MDADVQLWWVDNVECSVYMQYSCTDLLFLGLYPLFHMLQLLVFSVTPFKIDQNKK